MGKIIGGVASTTMPVPDWEQTNPRRSDFIKNKPDLSQKADVSYVDGKLGDIETALDSIIAIQEGLIEGGV